MRGWIALVLVSITAEAAPPTWQWEHPTPHGGKIEALHGSGATLHAVGVRGAILTSRDGGATWAGLASNVVEDLHAIGGAGALVVAVGDRGCVLRSRDGVTFERRPVASTASLVGVAVAASTVLVVGSDGSVLRSTDGGETFAALARIERYGMPTSIAIAPTGVFVGTSGGLYRSTNRGDTFTAVASEPIQRIAVDRGTIYAIAGAHVEYRPLEMCGSCIGTGYEYAALYRSPDGVKWQRRTLVDPTATARGWAVPKPHVPPQQPPGGAPMRGVSGPSMHGWSPRRALAIGAAGEVYASAGGLHVSADSGATFTTRAERGSRTALWATASVIVSTGEHGTLAVSRDRGVSWHELAKPALATANLFALAAMPSGRMVAVGMDGALAVRDGTWRKVAAPIGKHQRLNAVHAIDDRHVIVVGDGGLILQSADGGRTFQHRATERTGDLTAVWGIGAEVFAAGREMMVHSRDRGTTWHAVPSTLYSAHGFWGTAPDDLWLLGERIFHSTDRGRTWRAVAPALGGMFNGIWGSRADDVFIVGNEGQILHSRDRGVTWTPRASGTTRNLQRIWGRGDDLFVIGSGSYNGDPIVLHSRDHGRTWREEPMPADVALYAIAGSATSLYILGSGASILRRNLP